jgi:hypothetical protein
MENKKYTLIEFISGIFSILFLIMSFLSFGFYNFDEKKILKYKKNWNLSPISNIISVNLNSNCPENYEKFISNSFPGNFEGCNCFNVKSNIYKKKIYNETCTKNQIENDCKDILETNEINLSIWKEKKLCVKRMNENYNYFNLSKFITNKNYCENDFKFCGIIDTKNNFLCLPKEIECPISNILINNENSINNYKTIKLSNEFYLHFTNKETEKIYLEFLVNNQKFCFNSENGEFGENEYLLNKLKGEKNCEKIGNKIYDNRYENLDEISLINFYNQNKITNKLKVLDGYLLPEDGEKIFLYSIPYFYINNNCLNNIDLNNLLNPNLNKNNKILNVLAIFSFAYNFYLIGIFSIYCFINDSNDKKFLFIFIDGLKIIFLLIIIILSFIFLKNNNNILKIKNYFLNENCGEDETNFAIKNSYKNLNDVKNFINTIIFFAIVDILIRIFYYVYILCFKDKENKEKIQ